MRHSIRDILLSPLCWFGWHDYWIIAGGVWVAWVGCRRCEKQHPWAVPDDDADYPAPAGEKN